VSFPFPSPLILATSTNIPKNEPIKRRQTLGSYETTGIGSALLLEEGETLASHRPRGPA